MKHDGNIPPGTPRRMPDLFVVSRDPSHDDWNVCNLCDDPETALRVPGSAVGYNAMAMHLIHEHQVDPERLNEISEGSNLRRPRQRVIVHDHPQPGVHYLGEPGAYVGEIGEFDEWTGRIEKVERLVTGDVDVTVSYPAGHTPLIEAGGPPRPVRILGKGDEITLVVGEMPE